MKTVSILLYILINMKTRGGELHTNVCCGRYATVWQDIVFFFSSELVTDLQVFVHLFTQKHTSQNFTHFCTQTREP